MAGIDLRSLIPQVDPADTAKGQSILADVMARKKDEVTTSIDVAEQNRSALSGLAQIQQDVFNHVDKDYADLQKASRLPGGATGRLANIMGIINSDYNAKSKQVDIDAQTSRLSRATAQTETTLKINEEARVIAAQKSAEAGAAFTGFIQTRQLQQTDEETQLHAIQTNLNINADTRDEQRVKLDARRVIIAEKEENRKAVAQSVENLGYEESKRLLAMAKDGKGPFAGKAGLLELHIHQSEQAQLTTDKLAIDVKKGNREEVQADLLQLAHDMPTGWLERGIAEAKKTNSPVITIGNGPNAAQIPLPMAIQAFNAGTKENAEMDATLTKEAVDALNAPAGQTQFRTSAIAVANLGNPEAMQLYQAYNAQVSTLTMQSLSDHAELARTNEAYTKKLEPMIAQVAATMKSPEAKAGIISYAKTGKITTTSGAAVAKEFIGNFGTQSSSGVASAWEFLNMKVASDMSGMNIRTDVDAAMVMARIFQQGNSPKNLAAAQERVFSDASNRKEVGDRIKSDRWGHLTLGAIDSMVNQKGPDGKPAKITPVYKNLQDHHEKFMDGDVVNGDKLIQELERASIQGGGAVNYGAQIVAALKQMAASGDAADPTISAEDRHLMVGVFGPQAHSVITGGLANNLQSKVAQVHQAMMAQISKELQQVSSNIYQAENQKAGTKDPNYAAQALAAPSRVIPGMTINQLMEQFGHPQLNTPPPFKWTGQDMFTGAKLPANPKLTGF